ncbi:MAG: hypothetical protein WCF85_16170 [Rhodospirillaceae bacterium]
MNTCRRKPAESYRKQGRKPAEFFKSAKLMACGVQGNDLNVSQTVVARVAGAVQ